MENSRLQRDMITQPELWSLGLMVALPKRLDVMLYPPVSSEQPVGASLLLDSSTAPQKALESAIYDQPLLLGDFKSVVCIVADDRCAIVPPPIAERAADDQSIARALLPDDRSRPSQRTEYSAIALSTPNADMLMALDTELKGFVRRTYYNATFTHGMAPAIDVLSRLSPHKRMYACHCRERLTLLCFDADRLLMANIFECREVADAVYYILSCRQQMGIESEVPLMLWGDEEWRQQCGATLSPYLRSMSLLELPMLPYANSRLLPSLPIDLTLLPLCE